MKLLDMTINASKSACMRFGPCRHKSTINWVSYHKYLGVYLKVRLTLKAHTLQIKRVFTRPLTLYFEKLVVHLKCCLLYTEV